MQVSERSKLIKTSPTLALAAKAMELKEKGVEVISLSVGEPDWNTFAPCKEAGKKAIDQNKTRYTPASGVSSLKNTLAADFNKRFNHNYDASNVIVTPGAKYAIQQALWNLVNPGDKVGIFVPYWASYTTMVEIADGVPVLINSNEDGSLIEAHIQKAIDEGVKLFLINSPNNPSGDFLKSTDYNILMGLLKKHTQVQIILDDIYSDLYWGEEKHCPHLFDTSKEFMDRVLVISGASKAYSMTGWRMGWAIGSKEVIKGMGKYQSQTTGCPSSIAQEAVEVGIKDCQAEIKNASQTLKERAEFGFDKLKEIEGLELKKPLSAFYFWVNLKNILDKHGLDDSGFCNRLLESKAVVIVPGVEFGMPGYARLSFAVSKESFAKAVDKMAEFIQEL